MALTPRPHLSAPVFGMPECVWRAGAILGEGALWSPREQVLYWVDILGRQLHRLDPATAARASWAFDEEISALAEPADGPGLVVTLRRGFARFDPAQAHGAPSYLYRPTEEPLSNRFNDGKCDAHGRFWGGTMDFDCEAPTGALYGYSVDGQCIRHNLGFAVTNGPTWSLDGRTIFVNETARGRIHAWDFDVDTGALANPREWLRFAKGDGLPDGMTTDAAGRLWVAHWGGSCVSCHDPVSGAELARIGLPTSHITNCTFGGPDLRTLYVSSARFGLTPEQLRDEPLAGALFAIAVNTPCQPAHRFGP
jgi:sugar lactone lactonase YvrE